MSQVHFFDFTLDALRQQMKHWGLPSFRADQIMQWVYGKGVVDVEKMSNLSSSDSLFIKERMSFFTGELIKNQRASDGTQKLLLGWPTDSETENSAKSKTPSWQTECVMIPAKSQASGRQRRTACVSSQVGCPVGCKFCASGLGGLDGNLSGGQIVEQAFRLSHLQKNQPITNIVFMGMGEPLANFDAVTRATEILTSSWGMNLPGRQITISTVGLPAQIRRLARLKLTATLAISLHAPNDEIRQQIIPWAKFATIEQLIEAGQDYFAQTGREVTLEYILLAKVNDQPEHARQLAEVASKLRANINLIRYNEVDALPYGRPDNDDVRKFQEILKRAGRNVHIRASRGRDIDAACGQLRYEQQKAEKSG